MNPADRGGPRNVSSLELPFATEEERAHRLNRLSAEALKEHAVAAATDRDEQALWELVTAHLMSSGRRLSPHTLRAYRRGVRELLLMLEGEELLTLSPEAGVEYARRLMTGEREAVTRRGRPGPKGASRGRRPKRGPVAPATLSPRLAAGRALFRALRWAGATTADPFSSVQLSREQLTGGGEGRSRAYTEFELITLLANARDQQERVILLLGAHAGLRVSEMLELRWEGVRLKEGALVLTGASEEQRESVSVTPKLAEALGKYRREMEALGEPFREHLLELRSQYGIYNRLRRLCARAEVDFKGVQALRNAAGARLYRQTRDVALVQAHLRHGTLEAARVHAKREEARLKKSLGSWT